MAGYSHVLNAGFIDRRLNFLQGEGRGYLNMAEACFVQLPDGFSKFPWAVYNLDSNIIRSTSSRVTVSSCVGE